MYLFTIGMEVGVRVQEEAWEVRTNKPQLLIGAPGDLPISLSSTKFIGKFRWGLQQKRKFGAILHRL